MHGTVQLIIGFAAAPADQSADGRRGKPYKLSGRYRPGQFCQASNFASRSPFVHHTFFSGFVDGGLGFFELHVLCLAAIFRYGLANILDDAFDARFNRTVAKPPDFILARTFNC